MGVLSIVLAILAFGLLVVVHELGHFATAKMSGIQVNEFWVGMGPVLLKKTFGETTYSLRLLPFGGACVMEGEDQESDSPRRFAKAALWQRMLVIVAGALMNFITGFFIIVCIYVASSQVQAFSTTKIETFQDGFAYQGENMLMEGDEILKIDGYRTFVYSDISTGLSRGGSDGTYDFVVRRNGKKITVINVPLTRDLENAQGEKVFGMNFAIEAKTPATLLKNAVYTSVNFARLVWDSLGMLLTRQVGVNQLSGPVGVATVMAQSVSSGFSNFLMLVSFISINLGVMNLLPLPALDGGRLVFLIIEAVRRKPVPAKYEGYVHAVGLVLFLGLMIYVTGHDIFKLVTG